MTRRRIKSVRLTILPRPKSPVTPNFRKIVIGGAIVLGILFVLSVALMVVRGWGWTTPLDNKFGDQHLKTVVALIELHKIRNGQYPGRLSELQYTGDWDAIALDSVSYVSNAERNHYFVVVNRGWAGKPDLHLPEEFWKGTGYDPALSSLLH